MNRIMQIAERTEKGATILVADDSQILTVVVSRMLSRASYKVITAADGLEAVEKFRENRDAIRLFLSDIFMPGMNGKEAYDEIRKMKPDIKALFMTGHTCDVVYESGILESDAEIITKPFTPEELIRRVRSCMNGGLQEEYV